MDQQRPGRAGQFRLWVSHLPVTLTLADAAWNPFYADLLDRVRGLPRVRAAGITSSLPLGGEEKPARSFARRRD